MKHEQRLPDDAVVVKNLVKTYKGTNKQPDKKALKNITLRIPRGSLFGLLGPNGAGKSTLINILSGLVLKTAGDAQIWGYDLEKEPRPARSSIGIVPQELNLDPFFTPYELLDIQAGLYGVPKSDRKTEELLQAVGLLDQAYAFARTLSGGMRRRLMVAKAMVHTPRVLVLDEPTAGVDLELRKSLWAYVRKLHKAGTTVLLTTHYLEEAEALCDKIAIIHQGKLVACDDTKTLLQQVDSKTLRITVEQSLSCLPKSLSSYHIKRLSPHRIELCYTPSTFQISQFFEALRQENLTITDISTRETKLEDLFLQLTSSS